MDKAIFYDVTLPVTCTKNIYSASQCIHFHFYKKESDFLGLFVLECLGDNKITSEKMNDVAIL